MMLYPFRTVPGRRSLAFRVRIEGEVAKPISGPRTEMLAAEMDYVAKFVANRGTLGRAGKVRSAYSAG